MNYDFTTFQDCSGKDSYAFDYVGKIPGIAPDLPQKGFDEIPMWLADMNFAVAPSVMEAMQKRMAHPVFGYFDPCDAFYEAIIRWQEQRYQVTGLAAGHIGYEAGVLGGLIGVLHGLCRKGEPVFIHTPAYRGFLDNLRRGGYQIVGSPLVLDEQKVWRMDFEDMERKLADSKARVAIFCSPHNPCGRVWERWELERAAGIFKKYDVTVLSDEVWADLVFSGHRHIPFQMVNEDARSRTAAFYGISKSFNLAGLGGGYHIVYNDGLRAKVDEILEYAMLDGINMLTTHALIGAYSPQGEQWLEECCQVLEKNAVYAVDFVRTQLDGVETSRLQGTYMLFIDCSEWCSTHGKTLDEVLKVGWNVGVGWQDGRLFEAPCHIRINLALPFAQIKEAFWRMKNYVFTS